MTPTAIRIYQLFMTCLAALGLAEAAFILADTDAAMRAAGLAMRAAADGRSAASAALSVTMLRLGAAELVLAATLVVALAWRAPGRPEARALAIFLAYWLVPLSLMITGGWPVSTVFAAVAAAEWIRTGAFLRFTAIFPGPLTPADLVEARRRVSVGRIRRAVRMVLHAAGVPLRWPILRVVRRSGRSVPPGFALRDVVARLLLRPGVVWAAAVVGTAATFATRITGRDQLAAILWFVMLATTLQGLIYLFASYRIAEPAERRRLLWVVQGCYAAAWIFALTVIAFFVVLVRGGMAAQAGATPGPPAAAFAVVLAGGILILFVVLAALAVAIFYTGALDPSLVLRRTTVYGLVTFSAGIAFAILEQAAALTLQRWLHLSSGVTTGAAGIVVALGIGPLRARIARTVEQRRAGAAPGVEPTV